MATQLVRPSRIDRERIDRRNNKFDGDRRKISESYTNIDTSRVGNISSRDLSSFFRQAKSIIKDNNFQKRKQSGIPYIAIYLALVKDVLDWAQVTGVGVLVTIPISIIASGALIYWAWGKTSFRAWKEKILRWLIISVAIELFPATSLIPSTLIFVLIVHYNETKIIRLINLTIDQLERGGMLD
jgi:hypothetical protein